ncbi:hypothetical protein SAY86_023547 [Trapa natans]|uniref:Uncharacterized protein n=1 Tax=Trapa natans TaxID=22666 RepID=A0AAN7R7Z3_TRANT|nr:hypothetical protein SAY86_023547 [Trapa natans]
MRNRVCKRRLCLLLPNHHQNHVAVHVAAVAAAAHAVLAGHAVLGSFAAHGCPAAHVDSVAPAVVAIIPCFRVIVSIVAADAVENVRIRTLSDPPSRAEAHLIYIDKENDTQKTLYGAIP